MSDVARAFRLALTSPASTASTRGAFNVGTGEPWPLAKVARILAKQLGRPELEPQITGERRPGDIRHCYAAWSELGFAASVLLPAGLVRYARSLRK